MQILSQYTLCCLRCATVSDPPQPTTVHTGCHRNSPRPLLLVKADKHPPPRRSHSLMFPTQKPLTPGNARRTTTPLRAHHTLPLQPSTVLPLLAHVALLAWHTAQHNCTQRCIPDYPGNGGLGQFPPLPLPLPLQRPLPLHTQQHAAPHPCRTTPPPPSTPKNNCRAPLTLLTPLYATAAQLQHHASHKPAVVTESFVSTCGCHRRCRHRRRRHRRRPHHVWPSTARRDRAEHHPDHNRMEKSEGVGRRAGVPRKDVGWRAGQGGGKDNNSPLC